MTKELYRESTDPFQVTIEVLVPEDDRVTERALRLYIDRTPMKEAVYRHPNGDFVFESQARLEPLRLSLQNKHFSPDGRDELDGSVYNGKELCVGSYPAAPQYPLTYPLWLFVLR